jgi:probable rRNA maturation factor
MAVTVAIQNKQKKIPIRPHRVKSFIQALLQSEKILSADLSICLVTDSEMRFLNRKFHGHDDATDVLAFDLRDEGPLCRLSKSEPRRLEGEIIVSTMTAARNARTFESSPQSELALYLIHGLLHLLGYDDHGSTARIRKMRQKEQELLNRHFKILVS